MSANEKEAATSKLHIDLGKRSAIRAVNDDRYKLARYFPLNAHNIATTLPELLEYNDLELFDLHSDPEEMHTLALDQKRSDVLAMAMNEKLNALVAQEPGADDGSYLPPTQINNWQAGHTP